MSANGNQEKSGDNLEVDASDVIAGNATSEDRVLNPTRTKPQPTMLQSFAGVAGNILEWYDFAVYGYFADVISKNFFPKDDPENPGAALVLSFALFEGPFYMRRVGGVLLGWIGDKYGRKKALEISIFLMAFSTFAMGCLPTYQQVGLLSTALLVVMRMLQGLGMGGQLMSSLVYTLEQHPKEHWGFYGSYVLAAANFGILLGDLVGAFFREVLDDDQLVTWGWRIPYLLGLLVSLFGLYLKYYCDEESFLEEGEVPKNPFKAAFSSKSNLRPLIAASLVPMLWTAGFYLSFVWLAVFMEALISPSVPNAFWVNSASLFLSLCLFFPIAGSLSDRVGRVKVMAAGGLCFGIVSPLLMYLIGMGNPILAFFAQLVMGISLSFWGAPMMAWLVEAFPPDGRLTSVAIGYNVARSVMGGNVPKLATIWAGINPVLPGFLLTVIAMFSLIGLLCVSPPREKEEPPTTAVSARENPHFCVDRTIVVLPTPEIGSSAVPKLSANGNATLSNHGYSRIGTVTGEGRVGDQSLAYWT